MPETFKGILQIRPTGLLNADYILAADAFVAAVNRGDSDDEQARLYAIANREYEKATNRLRDEGRTSMDE